MNDVPADFLPLSHAVDRLADGMWGGLQRPEPVAAIKQDQKKLSLGFGPWREEAGQRLRAAAVEGELVIYVLAKSQVRSEDHNLTECSPEKIEPLVVPVNVVKRLIVSRGGLPDHPIRPSIQTAEGDQKLFALLTVGLLVVRVLCQLRTYAPQQTPSLFDNLVGSQQQRRWHLKSKRLRSFHINNELEFGRLTKGHVTRISAFENLRNLACDIAEKLLKIERIGHQPAEFDVLAIRIDCRNRVFAANSTSSRRYAKCSPSSDTKIPSTRSSSIELKARWYSCSLKPFIVSPFNEMPNRRLASRTAAPGNLSQLSCDTRKRALDSLMLPPKEAPGVCPKRLFPRRH